MSALRSFTFFAPVKPVGQNDATEGGRVLRDGRYVPPRKSKAMRDYQAAVALYGRNARIAAGFEPWDCPVEVTLTFLYAEDRPDNDGPQKATQDALAVRYAKGGKNPGSVGAGIFVNDKQVQATTSRKVIGDAVGVEVVVREVETAAQANTREAIRRLGTNANRRLTNSRRLVPSVRRYGDGR